MMPGSLATQARWTAEMQLGINSRPPGKLVNLQACDSSRLEAGLQTSRKQSSKLPVEPTTADLNAGWCRGRLWNTGLR